MLPKLIMLGLLATLLSACAKPPAGCNSVSCRPQSDLHQLTIWWQPELRNGPYDFTQVPVEN
ncbi:starvation-inducible outer membrane lipoprotein [Erwinia toletana]|uniref:Starvation-inducible outer membrane lipoprotein n=1 Tax=Winslowiella toletana TaxID=92490 RepID=A0ABS4PAB0_9GAMM|nr:HrpT family type III secretion system protein [Winslowiella toletana]MBP2169580.1 starvation-inducible outer membrane lipoprotein [Winslowiella toletana]